MGVDGARRHRILEAPARRNRPPRRISCGHRGLRRAKKINPPERQSGVAKGTRCTVFSPHGNVAAGELALTVKSPNAVMVTGALNLERLLGDKRYGNSRDSASSSRGHQGLFRG